MALDRIFNQAPCDLRHVCPSGFRHALNFGQCLAIDSRRKPRKARLSVIHLATPSSLTSPMSPLSPTKS